MIDAELVAVFISTKRAYNTWNPGMRSCGIKLGKEWLLWFWDEDKMFGLG